jgi:hypothetical protein
VKEYAKLQIRSLGIRFLDFCKMKFWLARHVRHLTGLREIVILLDNELSACQSAPLTLKDSSHFSPAMATKSANDEPFLSKIRLDVFKLVTRMTAKREREESARRLGDVYDTVISGWEVPIVRVAFEMSWCWTKNPWAWHRQVKSGDEEVVRRIAKGL